MSADDAVALAERLFAAIEAGDIDAVAALYAPDVVVWHNYDRVEQDRDENLATLRWIARKIADWRYEDVRRIVTPDGVVQQHVLRGTAPDGSELDVPAMMRIVCAGGQITRIEEYLDSAHVGSLLSRRRGA
jgi:ketosteroid isomerase-like protein